MTTTTEHPPCRRCRGTGRERDTTYRREQLRVLAKLTALGDERAPLVARKAYMTTQGRRQLDRLYEQARELIARGAQLHIERADMMAALDVTSPAYYKIVNGQTGARQ